MEQLTITLNDFLFNAGVVGFCKILELREKDDCIDIKGNTLIVEPEVFENFENDYMQAMMEYFEKDTRWYRYTSSEKTEWIKTLDLEQKEQRAQLEQQIKEIKTIVESSSYQSGLEIIQKEKQTDDPNTYIKQLKKEKDPHQRRAYLLHMIEHLKNNKEVYCMKDIIYNKVNVFWENVAFLNRQANKKNMQEEYRKAFVEPVHDYLEKTKKAEYTCIECGNYIGKSEARGLAFLKDVGTDEKRKTSAFWNFNEDAHLCPICSLIYSCVPLGFTMIGSNAIFINNNENLNMLIQLNSTKEMEIDLQEDNFEKVYDKVLKNYMNRADWVAEQKMDECEPKNIQVIKRVGSKDRQKYEIDIIAKDKLGIFKQAKDNFEKIVATHYYKEVVDNVLGGKNQFRTLAEMFAKEEKRRCVKDVLMIQIKSRGGVNVKENQQLSEQMIQAGENLQKAFFVGEENKNKLKAYSFKLQRALKCNNVNEFRKLFIAFYGGLNRPIPNTDAVKKLFQNPDIVEFKELGYAYVYGLEKIVEGGNKDEK